MTRQLTTLVAAASLGLVGCFAPGLPTPGPDPVDLVGDEASDAAADAATDELIDTWQPPAEGEPASVACARYAEAIDACAVAMGLEDGMEDGSCEGYDFVSEDVSAWFACMADGYEAASCGPDEAMPDVSQCQLGDFNGPNETTAACMAYNDAIEDCYADAGWQIETHDDDCAGLPDVDLVADTYRCMTDAVEAGSCAPGQPAPDTSDCD